MAGTITFCSGAYSLASSRSTYPAHVGHQARWIFTNRHQPRLGYRFLWGGFRSCGCADIENGEKGVLQLTWGDARWGNIARFGVQAILC